MLLIAAPGGMVPVTMSDTPLLFDRDLLRQRHERAAEDFSSHDFLLRHVGEDFLDRLEAILRDFPVTVNIGAFNGALMAPLRGLKGLDRIIQLGGTPGLIGAAEGLKVVADEELLPLRPASIDLILSAFALHFVNDLPGVLVQICRSLKPDGLMLLALPGRRTLFELREALAIAEDEVEGGVSPRVGPFADIRDCGALLQRAGFALPVADNYEVTVTYGTPFALMSELRAMGAGNVLMERRKRPMKRATLLRAVEIYESRYGLANGRVPATFEIITLTGWAPHENQQKPLRPGSAQMRLADALGVKEFGFGDEESKND